MSQRKQVALVCGTRPEVIKLAPVFRALKLSSELEPYFLSTGQHRQMLDQAFAAFDLKPQYDLGLMQANQTLPELTSRAILAVAQHLAAHRPSAVIVQGDTTTVLCAALAAAYERIPVAHVEAGLRTHRMDSPWPEEMNRRLTSPLARWSFAPTELSRENLLREGMDAKTIHVTGNTVIDSLLWIREKNQRRGMLPHEVCQRLNIPKDFSKHYLESETARWILVTGHRRESFGSGFAAICESLLKLVERHPDLGLLYPVHLNPNVREPVNRLLANHPRIALVEPAGYEDFVWLMSRCYFLLSDSGGVQEEAPSLGKPVLIMRETTERPEGVIAGTSRLVGTSVESITAEASRLLDDLEEYQSRSQLANPFGNGTASRQIMAILENELR